MSRTLALREPDRDDRVAMNVAARVVFWGSVALAAGVCVPLLIFIGAAPFALIASAITHAPDVVDAKLDRGDLLLVIAAGVAALWWVRTYFLRA
jgi:predicted cobalt transporter CbtA